MKNLEWKAELRDPNLARILCKHIGADFVSKIRQTDTYYNIARGRLKKRESVVVEDGGKETREPDQYVFYERADTITPKISSYALLTPDEMVSRFGTAPIPEWLVVTKTRELYLKDQARIHIDDVHELGWHFEFEIVLDEAVDEERAAEISTQLRATFDPAMGEAVRVSYSDLLAQARSLAPKDPGSMN